MRLTVVFDRSAFHGARFDLLQRSPLLTLAKQNAITVHHSQAFLEETISMYEKQHNHDELRKQLPFILEVCNGRWFSSVGDIWERELRLNQGPAADVFVDEVLRKQTESDMLQAVARSGDWPEFKAALPEKDVEREKQAGFHRALKKLRTKIEAKRRTDRSLKHQKPPTPRQFIDTEIEQFGAAVIPQYVATDYPTLLVSRWSKNKDHYPFFTTSLEGRVYSAWHAMVEYNKRIDPNAQIDIDLLSCLNRADAIVSADRKFQKDAFDVLWRTRGKLFLSPEEFVQRLERMAVSND